MSRKPQEKKDLDTGGGGAARPSAWEQLAAVKAEKKAFRDMYDPALFEMQMTKRGPVRGDVVRDLVPGDPNYRRLSPEREALHDYYYNQLDALRARQKSLLDYIYGQ